MSDSKTQTWAEFMTALGEHLGSLKRAQTNFSENSEYSLSTLQHWRKTNRVPTQAFDAIKQIDPEKCSAKRFTGYHPDKLRRRAIELSNQNKSLTEIAHMLSQEFNKPVSVNMIKGIRFRNKTEINQYESRKTAAG